MALNAIARSRLSEEERGGETLTSGPHGAVREGGGGRAPTGRPYCTARGGRGRVRGLTAAEWAAPPGATGPRARCERGVGCWATNGPRPGVSAGKKLGQGLGLGQIWCRGKNKKKTPFNFSEL